LRGTTPAGRVSVDTESGKVQIEARSATVTAPVCALSAGVLHTLQLDDNHTGVVMSSGDEASQYPMPFPVESVASFAAGLDWHMTSSSYRSMLVAGPDMLGFVHLLNVTAGGRHWSDLLQYGLGARLAHPVSSYDCQRDEVWLQVVYDVSDGNSSHARVGAAASASSSNASTMGKYRAYLTRHDVAKRSLLDVVPDPYALATLAFDEGSAMTYGIGWCAPPGLSRCLYRVAVAANKSTVPPMLQLVASLPSAYKLIMAGSATVSKGVLYAIMAADEANYSRKSPSAPLHCVADDSAAGAAICNRRGDGTQATHSARWQIVGVQLASGKVLTQAPQLDWDGASPEILLCAA
jgi:hypothetical protein